MLPFAIIVLMQDKLNSANIYLIKVNNKNTRKRCEICSKLTIKTPERNQWRQYVSMVDFEQVNVSGKDDFQISYFSGKLISKLALRTISFENKIFDSLLYRHQKH